MILFVFLSVVMQLRKACNHPYLFDGVEEKIDGEYQLGEHIVESSGKLLMLDKLLRKLQKDGHKVLVRIFFLLLLFSPLCLFSS